MKSNNFPLHILLSSLLLLNVFVTTATHADSLQDFIAKQKTIRIVADDAPGFGDQAASYNLVYWLRQKQNYTGDIEFVYGYGAGTKEKIISLFNLPTDIPDDWTDITQKIRFIKTDLFLKLNKNHRITPLRLGINGSNSDTFCEQNPWKRDTQNIYAGLTSLECKNPANFYNTDTFIEISPYPQPAYRAIGSVSERNKVGVTPEEYAFSEMTVNDITYIPMPASTILDAKKLVENNATLQHDLPALSSFIEGIIAQDFDVLPVYGGDIKIETSYYEGALGNMLQIIAAARYVQQQEVNSTKPLIIAVFYNYDQETQKLNQMIHDDNWEEMIDKRKARAKAYPLYPFTEAGITQARDTIKKLGLKDVFSIASLSQTGTINLFQQLKNPKKTQQIILLSMGSSLPKTIFDGIYTHTAENIWPQIRQGANSFSSLVTTGKPHFRCANYGGSDIVGWEIGYDSITDPVLQNRLHNFYLGSDYKKVPAPYIDPFGVTISPVSYSSDNFDNKFCEGMLTWQGNRPIYQALGDLFIDAKNPNSSLSQYFRTLKMDAENPAHDRIAQALLQGLHNSLN